MSAYSVFNLVEGCLWFGVAVALHVVLTARSVRQRVWLVIASVGFVLFGLSDFLESRVTTTLPWWLWTLKIGCGALLITARFGYLGWDRFSFRDRYVRFGLACLAAVTVVIALQWQLARVGR